ncbi:hypothetical protein C9374_011838 [Naegleria lovaniensis]|uniref:non-specific serine/threonine protein kinase n=1 Tax=Naegleria lovaniensis TaxID=51637 RepID=A0AA88GE59_NAELO|nr:uncharacterized protein C9374_011838 [Naegleria lovaniensis]KAG2373749.1 hypothetical protein C9374_011838 [Naegleria lovaniensis]
MGGGSAFPTHTHHASFENNGYSHIGIQNQATTPQIQPYSIQSFSSSPYQNYNLPLVYHPHISNTPLHYPSFGAYSVSTPSHGSISSLPTASPSLSNGSVSSVYSIPSSNVSHDVSFTPPRNDALVNQLFHNDNGVLYTNSHNSLMSTNDSLDNKPSVVAASIDTHEAEFNNFQDQNSFERVSPTDSDSHLVSYYYEPEESVIAFEKIGQGGFGSVYLIKTKSNKNEQEEREFAVKVLKDQYVSLSEIKRKFDHTNILPLTAKKPTLTIRVAKITHGGFPGAVRVLCIESPFMKHGSLSLKLGEGKRFSERTLWQIIQQMASALAFMYQKDKCLHRDIKPENILIKDYDECNGDITTMLGDFGLVRSEDTLTSTTSSGTPSYMAPEQEYSRDSDVFALGITVFKLITGVSKIDDDTFSNRYKAKDDLSTEIKNRMGTAVSETMVDMVIAMTQKQRPRVSYDTIQEVCGYMLSRESSILLRSPSPSSTLLLDEDIAGLESRTQAMSISNSSSSTQSEAFEYQMQRENGHVNRNNSVRILCSKEAFQKIETVELKIEQQGQQIEAHPFTKKRVKRSTSDISENGIVIASVYGSSHLPKDRKYRGPFKIILFVNGLQVDKADYKHQ